MTKNEFINEITDFSELKDFCYDNDLDTCDDVYDCLTMDELIIVQIRAMVSNNSDWRDIIRDFSDIPDGYDFYRINGYGYFEALDDSDFECYKNDVEHYIDRIDGWDEEEEDNEEDDICDDDFEDDVSNAASMTIDELLLQE